MVPGMIAWWKHARHHAQHHGCGAHAGAGCGQGHGAHHHGGEGERWASGPDDADFGGGSGPFGVRRPLRFLAYKLDLEEEQVARLAAVLDDLKTERAQAAVDWRRTTSAFADALGEATFDAAKVGASTAERVKAAERVQNAVKGAIEKMHALLKPEQRAKLAYLLRTGALSI
jgi:Spy/CpxP family protein refolding chaperone